MTSQYATLGVDAQKKSVRRVFSVGMDNDYPSAWVNITHMKDIPGYSADFSGLVGTQHGDGVGSKQLARLLVYRETGDESVLGGMVDDALSMNTGDVAAAGFVERYSVTDVLNMNQSTVPKQVVMEQVAKRMGELKSLYARYGMEITFHGGETADLPQQIRTNVFDITVHAIARKEDIIQGKIVPGDLIWGFASNGKAVWEEEENSGIMSNGLTFARAVLTDRGYSRKYPDLSGGRYPRWMHNAPMRLLPFMRKDGFRGRYRVGEVATVCGHTIDVHKALTSPTRQWAILIKIFLDKLKERGMFSLLHGMSMNTGGGATKIRNLGKGIIYEKRMPQCPPIFKLTQKVSGETWRNMFETLNCGVGIDIVGDSKIGAVLEEVAGETGVSLYALGKCCRMGLKKNFVDIQTEYDRFFYD